MKAWTFILCIGALLILQACPGNGNGFPGSSQGDKASPTVGLQPIAVATCTWGTQGASLEIDVAAEVYSAFLMTDSSALSEGFTALEKTETSTELRYNSTKFDLRIDISSGNATSLPGTLDATLSSGQRLVENSLTCTLTSNN